MDRYLPRLSERATRWARFLAVLGGAALLAWVAMSLADVLTPLLISLALAYIFNPAVSWLERATRLSRLTIVIVFYLVGSCALLLLAIYLGGKAFSQYERLQTELPEYVTRIGRFIEFGQQRFSAFMAPAESVAPASAPVASEPAASRPALTVVEVWERAGPWIQANGLKWSASVFTFLGGTFSNVVALVTLLVLIPMYTFFFLWRFNDVVATIRAHLPFETRETIERVCTRIDSAIADFFRGRLVVCSLVGLLNAVGWSIVGVPFAVVWGLLAGLLNLVPFVGVLALPPALLFAFLEADRTGQPWAWPVMLAMGVFLAVQALESFLLSPWVESRYNGLHPITTVVVLLIGAKIAGLLGMLLAIPLASTLKTLAAEWVLPEIRRLAQRPGESPAAPAGPAPPAPAPREAAPPEAPPTRPIKRKR